MAKRSLYPQPEPIKINFKVVLIGGLIFAILFGIVGFFTAPTSLFLNRGF